MELALKDIIAKPEIKCNCIVRDKDGNIKTTKVEEEK